MTPENVAEADHAVQVGGDNGGRFGLRYLNWSCDFSADNFAVDYDVIVGSDLVYDLEVRNF